MTIIAAFTSGDTVHMAADAMSTDTRYEGYPQNELHYPKIIKVGDALVGLAGEHVFHNLFRFHGPPQIKATQNTMQWIMATLLPWVEKQVDKYGPRKTTLNMLVARGGELYEVNVKQCDPTPVLYAAIGTGSSFAMGAMHALAKLPTLPPKDLVRNAVEAACHHDPYCGGRIDVMSTEQ